MLVIIIIYVFIYKHNTFPKMIFFSLRSFLFHITVSDLGDEWPLFLKDETGTPAMCEDIKDKFRGTEGGVPWCWGGEEGFFPLSPSCKLLSSLLEENWDKLA